MVKSKIYYAKLITLIFLYIFLFIGSIIFIYHITISYLFSNPNDWLKPTGGLLPGLNQLYLPAFGMYIHWWGGLFILILGLFLILNISRRYILIHRITGHLYCLACLITSLGGSIFIFSHGCVGGLNMNLAFGLYGLLLGCFTIITYVKARLICPDNTIRLRTLDDDDDKYTNRYKQIQSHKQWALRLWTLGISSLIYRILYAIIIVSGYHIIKTTDFLRPFDLIWDWLFFLLPLTLTELYIQFKNIKQYFKSNHEEELSIVQNEY